MTSPHEGDDAPVAVEVPVSEQRLRDAHAAALSRSPLRVLPYILWTACLGGFLAFLSLLSPKRMWTLDNLEALLLILFLALLSVTWVPAWRARRDYGALADPEEPELWTFSRERVACRRAGSSKCDFDWRTLYSVEKLPLGILLFPHPGIVHWLPKGAFAGAADFDRVAEWAAYGARRYRERRGWKLAEWLCALGVAPLVVTWVFYLATVVRSGVGIAESYDRFALAHLLNLPLACAASWVVGAPLYWLIGRFATRRAAAFVCAGALVGVLLAAAVRAVLGGDPMDLSIAAWGIAFAAGASVHWLIAIRR